MRNPNYVVGRGKLFFDQFAAGTRNVSGAERYLGNSPELSLSQKEDTLDHYNSDGGLRVKDASVTLQNDSSGSFTLDDISPENLALWFRGVMGASTVAIVTAATTTVTNVALGTSIQLGLTANNPVGVRNVTTVTATHAPSGGGSAVAVTAPGNFEVDHPTGRVHIFEDATDIAAGDTLVFTFSATAGTEEIVISSGERVEGRLVFIADNAAGENRDYIWPYVRLSPEGDLALKGDKWQDMKFAIEILKLNASTERQYIVKR